MAIEVLVEEVRRFTCDRCASETTDGSWPIGWQWLRCPDQRRDQTQTPPARPRLFCGGCVAEMVLFWETKKENV